MPSWQHELAARLVRIRGRLGRRSIERARWQMRWLTKLLPMPPGVERRPGTVGDQRAERLDPSHPRAGYVILYLHGGGYCLGSIETHRALAARIARAARCRVVLPDYPLAPENPFPAALQAVRRAYEGVRSESGARTAIFVMGDSAGGGLSLALTRQLTEEDASPRGVVCLSPWTDLTLSGMPDDPDVVDDPMVNPTDALRLARYYAGDRDRRDPSISPLFADLSGFPPLLLQVGTRELLLGDSTRLAERARAAGVDVTLEEYEGLMHAWPVFAPFVPEADRAIDSIGAWVERRMKGPEEEAPQ